MFGRRELLTIAVTLLVTIGNEGCRGESHESLNDNVNEKFVPTYKSKLEKGIQDLESIVPGGSSSSRSSESGGGLLGTFIGRFIPPFVKEVIVEPIIDSIAQGFGAVLNNFKEHVHFIAPGTYWCGDGNTSSSENDVGFFKYTDACCRDHDECKTSIAAGKTLGPLINDGIFTRSHCSCDKKFYKCLADVNSLESIKIGKTYFNVLRPQCFKEEYPIIKCENRTISFPDIVHPKCSTYSLNYWKKKVLQWFDNPDFGIFRNTSHPN